MTLRYCTVVIVYGNFNYKMYFNEWHSDIVLVINMKYNGNWFLISNENLTFPG